MSVGTGIVQLQEALKLLRVQWETTEQFWNDSVKRQFEADFLCPIEMQVKATHQAMEQLAQLITQAKNDVSL